MLEICQFLSLDSHNEVSKFKEGWINDFNSIMIQNSLNSFIWNNELIYSP